jgi:hypothetical protein
VNATANGTRKGKPSSPHQAFLVPGELQKHFPLPSEWVSAGIEKRRDVLGAIAAVALMPAQGNATPVFFVMMRPKVIGVGGFISWSGQLFIKDRQSGLHYLSPIRDEVKQRSIANGEA